MYKILLLFQIAKTNIETRYSVVGITEDFRTTLRVMAALVPSFLQSVPWRNQGQRNIRRQDQVLTNTTRSVLQKNMSLEFELYQFVQKRLYRQVEVLDSRAYI